MKCFVFTAAAALLTSCASAPLPPPAPPLAAEAYDLLIDDGTVYDGSGGTPFTGDIGIDGDRIVCVGSCPGGARQTLDARGLAVSPGFINMLSWANESLIADGRGLSDTHQGVTLEVFGEGASMGPWNERMKALELKRQTDIKYDIEWTTLGQYLEHLQRR